MADEIRNSLKRVDRRKDPVAAQQKRSGRTANAVQKPAHNKQPRTITRRVSRKFVAMAAMLLITISGTVAMADIPVIDLTVTRTLNFQFVKTIAELVNQLNQLRFMQAYQVDVQRYREVINGGWKDPLRVVEVVRSTAASLGVPIKDLGWDKVDKFGKEKATQTVAIAIDELNRIARAEEEEGSRRNTRSYIEEIYGDIPITRAGAPVEAAYRDMAETIAYVGESERAIEEGLKNADKIREEIERGGLSPGDLHRLQIIEADQQYRAQLQQHKAINMMNRLLIQQTGMLAGDQARAERARLKDRHQRYDFMANVLFSPALYEEKK